MTIELSPDLEQLIEDRAKRRGLNTEAYVASVLREAVGANGRTEPRTRLSSDERVREWDALMAEIERDPLTTALPLSDEALSRESIYEDERHRI